MSLNIEELKKKIIYRSSYCGSKEMDKILCSFVKDNIENLDIEELINLLNLVNLDDESLFKLKKGLNIQNNILSNKITDLFKKYNYRK